MEKTNEQRIEDLAQLLAFEAGLLWELMSKENKDGFRVTAGRYIYTADYKRPKWPTDESVKSLFPNVCNLDHTRANLKKAMLLDPIIQAAIELRKTKGQMASRKAAYEVVDAVKDAGL